MRDDDPVLVLASTWFTIRTICLAVIVGIWLCTKRAAQWAWTQPKVTHELRDRPPSCLVNGSVGHHSYLKLRNTKLHYVEAGAKDKPLILMLHGFPDCWLGWRSQISELSKHFRVVAVDLKGFGDSDKPSWRASYRPHRILLELRSLISALDEKTCIVMGHDLGGQLGWLLAHSYPEVVDKLIVVSCPHPNLVWDTLPSGSPFNSQWLHFVQLPFLPEMDVLKCDLKLIDQCYKHVSSKDEYLDAYKYVFSRKEDWTGPLNYYRNLPYVTVDEDVPELLMPVLLITGNKDPFCRLESVVQSSNWCENSLVKIIEGSGHWPHQESPEAFNKLVLSFLVGRKQSAAPIERSSSKGIMGRMIGAVSSTVKYGGSVIDTVQKKTNGVVGTLHMN